MERKNKSLYISEKNKLIQLNDIKKIVAIFNEVENSEVKIESDKFIFNSIEEIKTINYHDIESLKISISNPSVCVRFTTYGTTIESYRDDYVSKGIAEELRKYIKSMKNNNSKTFNNLFILLVSMFIGFLLFFMFRNNFKPDANSYQYSILFGLIIYSLFQLLLTSGLYKEKEEKIKLLIEINPNFFKKNKDEIIISVVMTLLGVVLGKIFDIF